MSNDNLEAALGWASKGYRVFPCEEQDGPLDRDGLPRWKAKQPKCGIRWTRQATTDAATIRSWWGRWPAALVGLPLDGTGIVVVDADCHYDGQEGVAEVANMEMDMAGFAGAPLAKTPHGEHRFFRQPEGHELGGRAGGALPWGVETRGVGNYIIAAGTMLPDGNGWKMTRGEIPPARHRGLGLPVFPDELLTMAEAPVPQAEIGDAVRGNCGEIDFGDLTPEEQDRIMRYAQRACCNEHATLAAAFVGSRNRTLNNCALKLGHYVGAGWLVENEVVDLLRDGAALCGLLGGEVERTIRSGLRKGKSEPASIAKVILHIRPELKELFESLRPASPEPRQPVAADGEAERQELPFDEQADIDDDGLHPGGLVEDIAIFICEKAGRPVWVHAIGAAIAIVGTLAARKVYTLTRPCGTHTYIGELGKTGVGKQHVKDCIERILDTVVPNAGTYDGWHVSMPSIAALLAERPATVMIADEFSDKLVKLRSHNASISVSAISETFRELWGQSVNSVWAVPKAMSRERTIIRQPALSLFGTATVRDFVEGLVSRDIANGLYNRFLILPRYAPVADSEDEIEGALVIPEDITRRCRRLHGCLHDGSRYPLATATVRMASLETEPIYFPFSPEARAMDDANSGFQRSMEIASEENPTFEIFARYREHIKRLALIFACGRFANNLRSASIEEQDMQVAGHLVRWSLGQLAGLVDRHMAESSHQRDHKRVLDIIRKARRIPRWQLTRRLGGSIRANDLDLLIRGLLEGGNIVVESSPTGGKSGRPGVAYRYRCG